MPFGQCAHLGDARGNLLPEQHAAAAGLGALPDHDLDGVGLAQMVGVHAVARGQHLVDENLRMLALLLGHAAVAGGGRGAGFVAPRPKASFAGPDSEPKLMPAMVIGILSFSGFFAKRSPSTTSVRTLAIALERITADGGAEKQQIVEMGHLSLGAAAANVIDAGRGARWISAIAFSSNVAEPAAACGPSDVPRSSVCPDIVDVEMVELRRSRSA